MKLADYLNDNGLTHADFAQAIGVSKETVRRYMVGDRRPKPHIMEKIATATDCQVTANDFFGIAA